ncbi:conserved hypothetical protein [Leishmania mexicana MHOM/GT/2001/U1103]|uniref:Uncharacterized protein n=1 Tax=Leishmania mexicana (strain MHOM/GT/2001/U1103) TaxID=929439 RepID=E9AJL5_LEIMU|nr:conserved hypothetical protein [Leishmania mexicana MHOM/GT/2001/U1103]CBZ23114.1 conserved hypothetical protein [Leishmania mexicana MHOM/GT/2001/U1103]
MSAVSPSSSGQVTSPTAFIATPSGFNPSGSASSFVKVYCGSDECVPLSKQCTSDVFQGVLSDLANRVRKHETQGQGSRSHRVKTVGNAAGTGRTASAVGTVAGSGGSDGKGESTPPASEDRVGAGGTRGRVVKGGGAGTKKRPSAPPLSTSSPLLPASKGVAPAAPSTESFSSNDTLPTTTDRAAASVGVQLAGESGARVACDVVYRRAELLPLSFVRDIASNSRVTALYKQHLQLQEELQRHRLEQQQLQQEWGEEEDDDAAASVTAAKAAKNDAADAASTQSTAGHAGGKGEKTPGSKPTPRRRAMPSVNRGGGTVSGSCASSSVSSAATSAVAATALAAQIRTQLWTALRNTIPFFGVLTMPAHTPMEPLISLPASGSSGASTPAARAAAATTAPLAAGVASAATAVCSGSYVLLGCRERPREETVLADATPVASQAGRCTPGDLSVIGGVAACPSMSAVERLVERAHEASVTRLPPLSGDALLRINTGTAASGGNSEGTKRSPRRQRMHPRDLQAQMSQQSLPLRCTLHPTTNRVVPMLPPLPDDIAAGYGAGRLVTKSLGQSVSDHSGDADDSATPSETRVSRIAANSRDCGHPDRAQRRSLDEPTDGFVSAVTGPETAGLRRPLSNGKGAPSTGLGKGSTRAGAPSNKVGEEASLMSAQEPPKAAGASHGPTSPSTVVHASSALGPGGGTHRDGDGPGKGMESGVPLSAAAIARLTPSTRFMVQLSSCTVTLTTQTRKGAGTNAGDATSANTIGAANSISGTGRSLAGCGETYTYADELTLVFDGLDVLWHGPSGEEALLQWVLDEYSVLLKQRMAVAMAQWTSMVHASDTSTGAAGESSSKGNKMRRQLPSERVQA